MAEIGASGGEKLGKVLAEIAAKAARPGTLQLGFFPTAKYPDGTYVAQVAFWGEYGTVGHPPFPFFRNMIAAKRDDWGPACARLAKLNGYDMYLVFQLLGEGMRDDLVSSIVNFPGHNAPSTIKRKGFDKLLIDTGVMQRNADFKVADE